MGVNISQCETQPVEITGTVEVAASASPISVAVQDKVIELHDVYNTLGEMLKELRKINIQLAHMNDMWLDNKDVG